MPHESLLATGNEAQTTSQDLPQLVRELYQEIVAYNRSQEAVEVLRDSTNVESGERGDTVKTKEASRGLLDRRM